MSSHPLHELDKESRMGAIGTEARREVRVIDLSDFERRGATTSCLRYSLAFFAQANKDALIRGPSGTYPPITAGDFLQQRVAANFAKY
jgi:hypothetical protein